MPTRYRGRRSIRRDVVTPGLSLAARGNDRQDRRREAYKARKIVWAATRLARVRNCGWAPRSDDGVAVRVSTCEGLRRAGLGNVQTCGSFWACPVCSSKIAAVRQAEISRLLSWWVNRPGQRGRVAFVTFTVRHTRRQSLTTVWDAVSAGLDAVQSGRAWKLDQREFGAPMARVIASGKRQGQIALAYRLRMVRVVEVTHGRNGWHVHVHMLLLMPWEATETGLRALSLRMFARWRSAVTAAGLAAPSLRRGVDARLLRGDPSAALGQYFVKAVYSASHEVASGQRKASKNGNRTPFGILADLVRLGEADDLDRWHEWERGSKRRRAVAYSAGLLAEAGVRAITDEEIAAEDAGGVTVATIDGLTWRSIRHHEGICDVLEAFEDSTPAGLALLARWRSAADDPEALHAAP